jgi:hypothetical protein
MGYPLTEAIQRYVAITSVGASTVRGSPKGTVDAARRFLTELSLRQFGVSDEGLFHRRLSQATEDLRRALPRTRRDWALARKLLNIFLHNAFYNFHLRQRNRLAAAEYFFEVPVDSAVARGLRRECPNGTFAPWPGLKKLDQRGHAVYQTHAATLAKRKGIARVYLDAVLWVEER